MTVVSVDRNSHPTYGAPHSETILGATYKPGSNHACFLVQLLGGPMRMYSTESGPYLALTYLSPPRVFYPGESAQMWTQGF